MKYKTQKRMKSWVEMNGFMVGEDKPRMTAWNQNGREEQLKFILVLLLSNYGILYFYLV